MTPINVPTHTPISIRFKSVFFKAYLWWMYFKEIWNKDGHKSLWVWKIEINKVAEKVNLAQRNLASRSQLSPSCSPRRCYRVTGTCNSICQRLPHRDALCVCKGVCFQQVSILECMQQQHDTFPCPIRILHFLIKSAFTRFVFSPSLSCASLLPYLFLCLVFFPSSMPLLHLGPSISSTPHFCFMSRVLSLPVIAFFPPPLYFPPTHFPPVWDCCSEPPSLEHVIPWPELFSCTMTGREMKSPLRRVCVCFFPLSFPFTVSPSHLWDPAAGLFLVSCHLLAGL